MNAPAHIDSSELLSRAIARNVAFVPGAPFFAALRQDPLLARARLIAEPWDAGPQGYQVGRFPGRFLDWNDRFRRIKVKVRRKGVEVRHLREPLAVEGVADVVVETFGCDPPEPYVLAMARRLHPLARQRIQVRIARSHVDRAVGCDCDVLERVRCGLGFRVVVHEDRGLERAAAIDPLVARLRRNGARSGRVVEVRLDVLRLDHRALVAGDEEDLQRVLRVVPRELVRRGERDTSDVLGAAVGGEPDRLGFGDEVPDGKQQPVVADDDALGPVGLEPLGLAVGPARAADKKDSDDRLEPHRRPSRDPGHGAGGGN